MNIIHFAILFVFISVSCRAVDYVHQQDQYRCGVYASSRDANKAQPFINNISRQLTNHSNINYRRTATDADREAVYKAMMGSVIVHGGAFGSFYKSTSSDARFQSHFDALRVIDKSIRVLWQGVLTNRYVDSLDQITTNLARQTLLTTHFVKWFYEALESYKHELNFFGGAASVEWFQQVSSRYSDAVAITGENIKILHTESVEKIGLFKALRNTSGKTTGRDRQIKAEYMSWLLAKAAGLARVVNPVIPVRIQGGKLIIDPENYDGTLEPFVGMPIYDHERGYPTAMENYPTRLRQLYSRVLNYASFFSISFTRPSRTQDTLSNFLRYNTSFKIDGLSSLLSKPEKVLDLYLPSINVSTIATYFSEKGRSFPQFSKYGFIENLGRVSRSSQYQDLELFNRSMDAEDLLSLVVFWHLTLQDDMNHSNIIFRSTADGKIVPTVDVSMGCTGGILKRVPMVYPLKQSAQPLEKSAKHRVSQISGDRLNQVMQAYQRRRKPSADKTKAFTISDQTNLMSRLRTIKQTVNGSTTVRQVMHGLIPGQFEGLQFQVEQDLLSWHQTCKDTLGCTVLDPFLNAAMPSIQGTGAAVTKFKEILGFRVPTSYLYPLEYVFSADWKRFLKGPNDGTNLQGYLPLTSENLLWGLGI